MDPGITSTARVTEFSPNGFAHVLPTSEEAVQQFTEHLLNRRRYSQNTAKAYGSEVVPSPVEGGDGGS